MEYTQYTDEQLIEKFRGGEKAIMDYLMEKYKSMVKQKAKAMYLLGGENDDLIQEGMIGLFKAVGDYDPEAGASFHSFADLCVSRQLYTAVRTAQRQKHMPLNSYVSLDAPAKKTDMGERLPLSEVIEAGAGSNPEETLLSAEYAAVFKEALKQRLSKMEEKVLVMHLGGMNYLDIARELDKSPKAIDNALQRIKAKARQLREEDW